MPWAAATAESTVAAATQNRMEATPIQLAMAVDDSLLLISKDGWRCLQRGEEALPRHRRLDRSMDTPHTVPCALTPTPTPDPAPLA